MQSKLLSFKQLCQQAGVDYWRALKRREAGMPEAKIFEAGYVRSQRVMATAVTVYGTFYPSMRAAVTALRPAASAKTLERWIKRGLAPEDAFARVPNPGYRSGIIYRITHKESGRAYVGLTVQSLGRRWQSHLDQAAAGHIKSDASLHAAIREFGYGAFEMAQIDSGTTKDGLEALERRWIKTLGTMTPNGFNIDPGGVSGGSNVKPVEIDGIRFGSTGAAVAHIAQKYGITESTAQKRLQKGRIDIRKPAKPGESIVKSKVYKAWSTIVHGAINPKARDYQPGVELHPAWREFSAFLQDVGHETDSSMCFARRDKSQGFTPSNCAWMTKSEASKVNAAHMKTSGRLVGRPPRGRPAVASAEEA